MTAIAPEQRLLNLILGLSNTRHRLTRAQIRDSIEGYAPAPSGADEETAAAADSAFERMFERDKKALRELGIPLETVVDPAHGDEIGYRIRPAEAAMPPLELTAAELAVVGLAADYWQDAALGTDARQAVMKLASSAEHGPRVELPFAGRATRVQDAVAALIEAVADRQAVRFEYSSASGGTGTRTLEPWKVVFRGGVAYVVGHDRDREDARIFRVQRIGGAVRRVGDPGAYAIPEEIPLGLLAAAHTSHTATVALRPESGHALRRRGRAVGVESGWDLVEVDYTHDDALRAEVLALGGAARIVTPRHLALAVERHAAAALEVGRG
ncbi:WYL domain-containing protein [Demequina sp. SYSU T00039]|uniref:WYL domain-containing protein n=1 Tax=Demequina lignilytica TaxID=3051663 RepID=A0AAW7M0J0_9MICO|nr:WYL domain-containing protein [Demequina sp. SYSU T00039]MDN4486674.1 WYL domain-containing protein [Demequina sp. SYSU T00039]